MVRGLLVVVACAMATPAWAFPVCNVSTADGFEDCLLDVDPGGEIVVLPGLEVDVRNLVIDKDLTIRCQDPAQTYTLVHTPYVDPPADPWSRGYPLPAGSMLTIDAGAEVLVQGAELELYDDHPDYPGITLSRAFKVGFGSLTLEGISLTGQTAARRGLSNQPAAFLAEVEGKSSSLTILSGTFTDLDATQHLGGAIYAVGDAQVTLHGPTRFDDCSAYKGGAVLARYGARVDVVRDIDTGTLDVEFLNNRAQAYGGAIHVEQDGDRRATVLVEGGLFDGNSSFDKGGAISALVGDIELYDSFITGGSAQYGGAVYSSQGTALIVGGFIDDNRASEDGGAVMAFQSDGVRIEGSSFLGNETDGRGGVLFSTDPAGADAIFGSALCANAAVGVGDAVYVEQGGTEHPFTLMGTLIDGDDLGSGSALVVDQRAYDITQSTFVRSVGTPVWVSGESGPFDRNVIGWSGGTSGLFATTETSLPGQLTDNAWYDPTGSWESPVLVATMPSGAGEGGHEGPLGMTGYLGDGELGAVCDVWSHALRPDSPLVDGDWTAPDAVLDVRGFLGGAEPFSVPSLGDPWMEDFDRDGVIAMWDCDDYDETLGVRLEQYTDLDGDGKSGTLVEDYPCTIRPGNSVTVDDCDDADESVFQDCDTDTDTDSPGPAEPFRYGSTCSSAPSAVGAPLLLLVGLTLVGRRRRRG